MDRLAHSVLSPRSDNEQEQRSHRSDRGARRQKSFDPHAFGMITTLASPGERSLSSCYLFPRELCINIKFNYQRINAVKTVPI
jgi:hypothetical protein